MKKMTDFSVSYGDCLAHHGIKGQKWGVRRYQNEDGTLTTEGKKRYGTNSLQTNSNNKLRKHLTADYAGIPGMFLNPNYARSRREDRLKRRVDSLQNELSSGKAKNEQKTRKLLENKRRRYDIQKSINIDREKYEANMSTGKRAVRSLLPIVGPMMTYNDVLKQEGYSKGRRIVKEAALFVPYANIASVVFTKAEIAKKRGAKGVVDHLTTRIN